MNALLQSILPPLRLIGVFVTKMQMRACNPMAPHYGEYVLRVNRWERGE